MELVTLAERSKPAAALGFGLVRLKLLLALSREACLDTPGWSGEFVANIGARGQVKAGVRAALREVRIEEEKSPGSLEG
jgi:hypothetical protein